METETSAKMIFATEEEAVGEFTRLRVKAAIDETTSVRAFRTVDGKVEIHVNPGVQTEAEMICRGWLVDITDEMNERSKDGFLFRLDAELTCIDAQRDSERKVAAIEEAIKAQIQGLALTRDQELLLQECDEINDGKPLKVENAWDYADWIETRDTEVWLENRAVGPP